eukprot:358316-Chlamydomonas_euryale.AAC.11
MLLLISPRRAPLVGLRGGAMQKGGAAAKARRVGALRIAPFGMPSRPDAHAICGCGRDLRQARRCCGDRGRCGGACPRGSCLPTPGLPIPTRDWPQSACACEDSGSGLGARARAHGYMWGGLQRPGMHGRASLRIPTKGHGRMENGCTAARLHGQAYLPVHGCMAKLSCPCMAARRSSTAAKACALWSRLPSARGLVPSRRCGHGTAGNDCCGHGTAAVMTAGGCDSGCQ